MSLSIAISLLPVFSLKLTQKIVDNITGLSGSGAEFGAILTSIIMFALLSIMIQFFNSLTTVVNNIMYNTFSISMQEKLIDNLRSVPLRMFDKSDFMSDLNAIKGTVNRLAYFITYTCNIIGALTVLISMLVLALRTSMAIFVTAIVILIYSTARSLRMAYRNFKRWDDDKEIFNRINYWSGLPMSQVNAREARTFQIRKYIMKKFSEPAEVFMKNEIERSNAYTKINIEMSVAYILFRAVFLGVSLLDLTKGIITAGGVVMVNAMLGQIYSGANRISYSIFNAYGYLEVLGKQMNFFNAAYFNEKEPKESIIKSCELNTENGKVFELREISYEYNDGIPVLDNISLEVSKGEVIALVGENGSGKSTLIKLILGLYTPTKGQMYLYGKPYGELSRQNFCEQIGVSFQDYCNYALRFRESVGFGNLPQLDNDEIIMNAMKKGGADGILKNCAQGLNNYVTKRF
ncbi:MAG: ABC transporter ATP-binding protein, partial [Dehalococcoidales bacterium]|nr:ABC transporter ATP-binding protein [Dehalococcoidales bacterium]